MNPHRASSGKRRRIFVLTAFLVLCLAAVLFLLPASPTPPEPPAPTPQPSPTPTATPAPTPSDTQRVQAIINDMTLHEKICQLFIVFPEQLASADISAVTQTGDAMRKPLADFPVGGFIYLKNNLRERTQVIDMLTGVQNASHIPLFLAADEEGGRISRLADIRGTTALEPMLSYKEEGAETARKNAETIARDMAALGLNLDFAPVADVWSSPDNTVIGDRAYSDSFSQAAELIPAAVQGFHAGGVACTLKHFPGHGDTSADSHYGSVYVYKTREELRQNELLPFRAGIDAGADAVMIGHLIVSELDSDPAPFSYTIVTELLREELGFDGVVITDALNMQAMTDHYSDGEIAVRAVAAGVDILLCPSDLQEAVAALEEAVQTGRISQERLDKSVQRILTVKLQRGILQ